MSIRLIATDIDGTLLNSQHQLTPHTETVIRQAIAKGVIFILATGRARTTRVIELIQHLGLTTPGIFLQGGAIYQADGTILHNHALEPELARQILTFGGRYSMVAYSGLEVYTAQRNYHVDTLVRYQEATPQEIGSLLNLPTTTPINKCIIFDDTDKLPAIRGAIIELAGEAVNVVQTLPTALEIIPSYVSKGHALEELMADYGLSPAEVMACGDAENDITMLQTAGIGVAMGNAMPQTKAAATYITASNDEDGVAEAIQKFVL